MILKIKGFKEVLLKTSKKPIEKQNEYLENEFQAWKGSNSQTDDILVIGIKF